MDIIKPQKYDFKEVKGLSLNQLKQHEKLYVNYVNQLNKIRNINVNDDEYYNSNSVYSKMRSLKVSESYALNGVKLHELYFQNLQSGNKESSIARELEEQIIKDFGSTKDFFNQWKSIGLAMRGWVLLVYDNIDGKLHIIGQDEHDVGSTIGTLPLLVMDVYEHAYMIDYGIDRKGYIEAFIKVIDWNVINDRFSILKSFI